MELKEYRFDEVTINFDKKRIPLSGAQREKRKGKYRYYGAQGIIDYIDDYIFDGTYLLIAEDGENLKSKKQNIAQVVDGQFWVNNHAHIVQGNEFGDTRYLCYLLNSMDLSGYVTGSAQPKLSQANLNAVTLYLPSIDEQRKLVRYLYMFDQKIEVNNKINDNLYQQAQAIFINMFANNSSTTSTTIADVALNVTDGVHNTVHDDPDGDYLLLSCKNIKGGSLSIGSNERTINKDTFDKLRRRTKLAKGDVLISSVGTVGELLMLNSEPNNYEFQRSVAIVKPNPQIVSSVYLFESLTYQRAELINAAHGAVQQCLFISDIAGFPINIPDREELLQFNNIVNPMFDIITANESENRFLSELRDSLLPKLMSGEIDVTDIQL